MPNNVLPVPRHDDTNTTTCDVTETDVESTEFVSDDDEHAERLRGVLNLRQEVRCKAERKRDLSRLVEVGLEDVPRKKRS